MLRHAYFPDFESGPKFVIWGDADDMRGLMDVFNTAAKEPSLFSLCDLSIDGSRIVLETTENPTGVRRDTSNPGIFHWQVDQDGWYAFAEQVETLTNCSPAKPAHQLLECLADGEIIVMVSCGEYPDDLKP
jgi:hypothetical protein